MPSSFSPSLRIELIAPGEQAGTWNTTTNTNLGTVIESSIAGAVAVSITSAAQALTTLDGAADQSRNAVLQLSTTTTAAFSVYAPPVSKLYTVYNTSAYAATIYNSTVTGNTTAAGTGVTIPAGRTLTVWTDGTNFRVQNDVFEGQLNGTMASGSIAAGVTGTTQAVGTSNTTLATTAFVNAEIANDAPTKTGGGASGTWDIAITGNAATATSATNLTGTTTASVQTSALATGTANNTTFLRGDRTWQTINTSPTTDQVLAATAGASYGAVGTYAWLASRDTSSIVAGSTYAGSGLVPAGVYSTSSLSDNSVASGNQSAIGVGSGALSGTWMAMGSFTFGDGNAYTRGTLFLRVS
jgi:hypothetical protein